MEKSESMAAGGRNGTPGSGNRSRSRMGMVHSQPGSRSTSPTSLRSYHTYYDAHQQQQVSGRLPLEVELLKFETTCSRVGEMGCHLPLLEGEETSAICHIFGRFIAGFHKMA